MFYRQNMLHEKLKNAKRALQKEWTRCRDEKYAGRAGPPDCAEVEAGTHAESVEKEADVVEREVETGAERDESVGGWDIVGGEEHLHSPGSCPPPCTSHRLARCTVS